MTQGDCASGMDGRGETLGTSDSDWQRMARLQQGFHKLARTLLPAGRRPVSSSECEVLAHLYLCRAGLAPHELSTRTGMKRESVSRCLKALRERGLIAVTHNPADERARIVVLTPAGEQALRAGLEGVLQPLYDLRRAMGEESFNELFDLLDQALSSIDTMKGKLR